MSNFLRTHNNHNTLATTISLAIGSLSLAACTNTAANQGSAPEHTASAAADPAASALSSNANSEPGDATGIGNADTDQNSNSSSNGKIDPRPDITAAVKAKLSDLGYSAFKFWHYSVAGSVGELTGDCAANNTKLEVEYNEPTLRDDDEPVPGDDNLPYSLRSITVTDAQTGALLPGSRNGGHFDDIAAC